MLDVTSKALVMRHEIDVLKEDACCVYDDLTSGLLYLVGVPSSKDLGRASSLPMLLIYITMASKMLASQKKETSGHDSTLPSGLEPPSQGRFDQPISHRNRKGVKCQEKFQLFFTTLRKSRINIANRGRAKFLLSSQAVQSFPASAPW